MSITAISDISGSSAQNLLRTEQLCEVYALDEKLSPSVREISWSDLLYLIVLIEKAGTGIRRMIEDARKHKCPEPKFTVNGFFTATFWPNIEIARKITGQVTEQVGEQVSRQVGTKLALSRHQVEILHNCLQEKSLLGIMSQVGRKDRTKFF
jgi:ATP-dependent DNA helicase RecG